jgi:hypothetical protein
MVETTNQLTSFNQQVNLWNICGIHSGIIVKNMITFK